MTVHVLVEAVALVYFDHDHGPHFAEIYPENYLDTLALPEYALYSDYLSVKWRDQIRFSALPDDRRIANEPFCDAKPPTQYLFFLHNPSDLLSLNPSFCGLEAASLASHTNYESHDSNHVVDSKDSIAAYVIHSRELDPDSKRGIYQSSVVLLSRRPYNSFYFQLYSLFDGLQCSKEIYNCLTDTFSKHIKSKEAFHIRLSNNHIYSVLFTETGLIQCARAGESTNGLAKSKGQLKPFLQNCGEYLWDVYESIFLNIPIVVYGVDPEHVSQTVLVLHQFVVSSSGLTFEGLVSPIVTLHDDYVKSLITNMKHNGNLKNKISKSGGFIVGTMNPILVELAVKSKVVTIIRLPGPQLAPHSDPKLPRCGSQPLLEAHPKLPLKTPQDGEGDLQTEPPRTAPLDIPKTEKNIDFVISSSPSSQSILKKLMGPIKNLSSNSLSGYSSLPAELADGNPVPVSFSAEIFTKVKSRHLSRQPYLYAALSEFQKSTSVMTSKQVDEIQEKVWEYLEELTERLLHPIHMYLMSLVSKVQENNSEMRISPRPILGELVRFEDFFNFLEKTDSSITVPFRPSFSSSLLNLLSSGSLPYQDFYMNFFESRNFVLWFQRQRRYFQTQIDKRYFESLTLLSLPGEQSEREIYFTFLRLAVELIKESYAEQFQDLLSLLESILYNNT